jgi:hypothetical protein
MLLSGALSWEIPHRCLWLDSKICSWMNFLCGWYAIVSLWKAGYSSDRQNLCGLWLRCCLPFVSKIKYANERTNELTTITFLFYLTTLSVPKVCSVRDKTFVHEVPIRKYFGFGICWANAGKFVLKVLFYRLSDGTLWAKVRLMKTE